MKINLDDKSACWEGRLDDAWSVAIKTSKSGIRGTSEVHLNVVTIPSKWDSEVCPPWGGISGLHECLQEFHLPSDSYSKIETWESMAWTWQTANCSSDQSPDDGHLAIGSREWMIRTEGMHFPRKHSSLTYWPVKPNKKPLKQAL